MASETVHNDTAPKTIVVKPAALDIGAEIDGVDLSQPLSAQQKTEIWDALVQWKVISFRSQKLNKRSFINFSRQFGALNRGHNIHDVDPEFPEIYGVVKGRQSNRQSGQPTFEPWTGWHTDLTPAVNPPTASILWGKIVPPNAGDTQWTNLVAAYDALSPTMKKIVDGLRGIHTYLNYGGITPTPEYMERIAKNQKVSEHPIVRVHPESKEKVLWVSPKFLLEIVGMTPTESNAILAMLKAHAIRPEFTYRLRWRPGSVVMWDNRSTAHLAPRDLQRDYHDRKLFRTTLVGDLPVGVDGQQSKALEGSPLLAA
ncbi:MAG: taurine dioxygenase [Rhodospirillaceae bacterium]|nr:taurine dioxygenase [Rhodospirillaceae bacterium]|tara:strand:+ start:295 stop:1233 length:939 start_codon:yes stop_codon:yes gene_type:complete